MSGGRQHQHITMRPISEFRCRPLAFLNVQRRDLTAAQRAIAAAKTMDKVPERRGRPAGGKKVDGQSTILSREFVGRTFKVGEKAVQQAKALLTEAPDLAAQVEDKRRAVEMALKARPGMSDRAIAEHCGVHWDTVGRIRQEVQPLSDSDSHPPTRTGRDGRTINVGNASPARRTLFDYGALDAETRIVVQQRTTEIKGLMKRAASDLVDIGSKLIEVKQRLGHGRFGGWLALEFDWHPTLARQFMNVAEVFGGLQIETLSRFGPSALRTLAAPSTPESAREQALALAQQGQEIRLAGEASNSPCR